MANLSATCPICQADNPLDTNQSDGEEIYCCYCQSPVIARKVDRYTWVLVDIDEDRKTHIRKAAKKAEAKSEEEGMSKAFQEFEFDDSGGHGGGKKGGGH